ncbi:MAG TPA: serine hydrolase domain-containing protein [Caulobacteraceae bacterium]|nr:serine hydrolase domain-containing protein [Caulobacteraceae bacterium]
MADPAFEAVRAAFAENFERPGDFGEVGAAVAVYHHGRCVVDLWGGFADRARARPWTRDTLVNVWSATKGAAAVAVARLVDQGLVAYDDPVASVWPEFAQAGKAGVTIGQAMSHQAGLPGFAEPTRLDDLYDWAGCVAKLERQAPAWPPGSQTSYHAMTFGFLAGEIVRRVAGVSPGAYIAREIAGPLGADIHVGLPEALEPRVADTLGPKRPPTPPSFPQSDIARGALANPATGPLAANRRAWRAAELPAANGQASAQGLARLYAALAGGGALEGVRVLSPETVARMTAPAAPEGRRDQFLGFTDCWAMGVMLNTPGLYGPDPRGFGHSGWGGSFGCAHPGAGTAIGYVCNQMGPDLTDDPRASALCAAVARCAALAG